MDASTVQQLNREMDRVKSQVFLNKNAAFFGSLLCSLDFKWDTSIETAATDGVSIWWNPEFFKQIESGTNKTILMHELEHAARLHHIRAGNRDPEIWNYACDIRINNGLENEGYSFKQVENCWKDHSFDMNGLMAEEDIYDLLIKNNVKPKTGSWNGSGKGDMLPNKADKQTAVNNVVRAVQQAKLSGNAGSIPGGVEELINKFTTPIVPWEQVLMQFFTDMLSEDFSWKRPNRRYSDMYLPSRFTDDGRLTHLMYFLDVSGSISETDIIRFNSEVKYIQEELKPEKLSLVQFDTKIQQVDEFEEGQPFNKIDIIGRGGTCLECVHAYIERHDPTAVVVFSDLYCKPMQPLKDNIPIIWAVNNMNNSGPFGKTIRVID